MSPLSAGLFHRGISHSGTATAEWVLAKNPLEEALAVAELVNCFSTDQHNMINCMRTKPGADLVRTVSLLSEKIGTIFSHPVVPYAGVVEEEHDGAFITHTPREYLKQRRIQTLPWLTSVVKDEGVFLTADLYSDAIIAKINNNWNHYATLLIDANTTDTTILSRMTLKVGIKFGILYAGNVSTLFPLCHGGVHPFAEENRPSL
jgi:carboxylesterase type B